MMVETEQRPKKHHSPNILMPLWISDVFPTATDAAWLQLASGTAGLQRFAWAAISQHTPWKSILPRRYRRGSHRRIARLLCRSRNKAFGLVDRFQIGVTISLTSSTN